MTINEGQNIPTSHRDECNRGGRQKQNHWLLPAGKPTFEGHSEPLQGDQRSTCSQTRCGWFGVSQQHQEIRRDNVPYQPPFVWAQTTKAQELQVPHQLLLCMSLWVWEEIDKVFNLKQIKTFFYLYITEDISVMAAYEVYCEDQDQEEFIQTLSLIYKIYSLGNYIELVND